jgi:hypothetical protein
MRFVSYHYRSALQIMGAGICPSVSAYGRKRTLTDTSLAQNPAIWQFSGL